MDECMCQYCDYNSNECCIFIVPLDRNYYLDIKTSEWDEYDDGFVHQKRIYKLLPAVRKKAKRGGLNMDNFEEKLLDMLQKKILSDISKQELISVKYDDRIPVPENLLTEVYMSLDIEVIKKKLKERLEEEMADKIANKMITEYSNDIKQIMCNRELREELRSYMRGKIRKIADDVCISVGENNDY